MSYRANAQVLSVKDFGAHGNGSGDDTAAIQATINAAQDGDSVFFPNGSYSVTSQISWSGKSLNLLGTGKSKIIESTVIAGTGSSGAIFYANGSGVSDSSVEGLMCAGAEVHSSFIGASTKDYCFVRFQGADGVRVENVKVTGKSIGVVLDVCTNARIERLNFNSFLTTAASGSGTGTDAFCNGVKLYAGSRNSVSNLIASNCGSGVNQQVSGSTAADRLMVTGATIDTCWDHGIYANGSDGTRVLNCSVSGVSGPAIEVCGRRTQVAHNELLSSTSGVQLSGWSGASADSFGAVGRGAIVEGNRIETMVHDGIKLAAVSGHDIRNSRISGNYVKTTGTATGAFAAINVTGYFHQITGNTVEDAQGLYGIFLNGSSGDYVEGIDLSSNFVVTTAHDAFYLQYVKVSKMDNNMFRAVTGNGINMFNCETCTAVDNRIEASVSGTFISATTGNGNTSNTFYNNDPTVDAPGGDIDVSGADAVTLDGASPSVSATASTIVERDGSGTIQAVNHSGLGTSAASGYVPVLDGTGHLPSSVVPAGSGDASTLNGLTQAIVATASTIVERDSSGTIQAVNHSGLGTSAASGFVPVLDGTGHLPTSVVPSAIDAATVTGIAPATAATASTLVERDASGTIQASNHSGLGTSAASGFVPVLDGTGHLPVSTIPSSANSTDLNTLFYFYFS